MIKGLSVLSNDPFLVCVLEATLWNGVCVIRDT